VLARATPPQSSAAGKTSPLRKALAESAYALWALALVSGVINMLMLTGSIFMIQVYDRVLSSRSLPTLLALSGIAVFAYLFQGSLDIIRSRVLTLVSERFEGSIGPDVHKAVAELPLRGAEPGRESLQPFRDLDAIRSFLSGAGAIALFDLPWLPIYMVLCYLFHPYLGYLAMSAGALLFSLTALTEAKSRGYVRAALDAQSKRNLFTENAQRGADAARAMGMLPRFAQLWRQVHEEFLTAQRRANFIVGGFAATSKMLRMLLQSCMLGLGAYLAINGEISAGTIIATSILSSRALAPVDQIIATWKGFVAARQGYGRLRQLLQASDRPGAAFRLPKPHQTLAAEGLFVAAPGMMKPIIRNVSLSLSAGQTLGIIGVSASGKSTLAKGLVGVWPAMGGTVNVDGAALHHWNAADLGAHIGYLPQEIQLFDGTIAENIARFQDPVEEPRVIEAATAAGFHNQILQMPQGYETRLGRGGIELSGGQKQRVGLARALYGNPFFVVLDEPNSNLDVEGEAAVAAAIASVGKRGGIAIVIAHRPSAIAAVDLLAVVNGGELVAFGPKDEVLGKTVNNAQDIRKRPAPRAEGFRVVQAAGAVAGAAEE
jgi:ATP-binding cassette, subfamily C, type I secretion system permease/ATPase